MKLEYILENLLLIGVIAGEIYVIYDINKKKKDKIKKYYEQLNKKDYLNNIRSGGW